MWRLKRAGNFDDVFKHSVLCRLFLHLRDKDRPFTFVDLYAGAGAYDISMRDQVRLEQAQRMYGPVFDCAADQKLFPTIGAERPASSWSLDAYMKVLRRYNRHCISFDKVNPNGRANQASYRPYDHYDPFEAFKEWLYPRPVKGEVRAPMAHYPGAPLIARYFMRPIDNAVLVESDPDVAAQLASLIGKDRRIAIESGDVRTAVRYIMPPRTHHGLVFIDPPYHHPDAEDHLVEAIHNGFARWPTATFAIYYDLKLGIRPHRIFRAIRQAGFRRIMGLEIDVRAAWPQESQAEYSQEADDMDRHIAEVLASDLKNPTFEMRPELTPDLKPDLPPMYESEEERVRDVGNGANPDLAACGMLIVNPPHQFETDADRLCSDLVSLFTPDTYVPPTQPHPLAVKWAPAYKNDEDQDVDQYVHLFEETTRLYNLYFMGMEAPETFQTTTGKMSWDWHFKNTQMLEELDKGKVTRREEAYQELKKLRKAEEKARQLGLRPAKPKGEDKVFLKFQDKDWREWHFRPSLEDVSMDSVLPTKAEGNRGMPIFQHEQEMKKLIEAERAAKQTAEQKS